MKDLSKFAVLFLLTVFVNAVWAQEQELSWTAKQLKKQVEQRNIKAILEAADTGDITLIPYLKQLSSDLEGRNNQNHPSFYAHVALAKLGDDEAIQQILAEVDDESTRIQSGGMHKLSLVGGKVAFKKFYELLDDTRPREDTDCQKMFDEHNKKHPDNKLSAYCDILYFTKSVTAMSYLIKMVENPPVKTFYGTQKEINIWKDWFKKNNRLIN
jgi:hypothetical protein